MTTLTHTARPIARHHTTPRVRSLAPPASTASVLTFNIGAAGEVRAAAILRWLRQRKDDLIVLTETTDGTGTGLLARGLQASGYSVRHAPAARERGVLIASRMPIALDFSDDLGVTLPYRASALAISRGDVELVVLGVYIPSRDRTEPKIARKEAFITSLLGALRKLPTERRRQLVLAGDYNVVARSHEPRLPGFFPWEYGLHDQLDGLGLRPAHELRPCPDHPHSWIGRTGLRYLYDYMHLGAGLHQAVERCSYLHGPRERRLSDHAALAVRIRLA